MKSISLGNVVLTGQGGGGSFSVGVPNPAPGVGPAAGVDASYAPAISGAADGAKSPTDYPEAGGPSTSNSQYSTIGPVPEG